MRRACAQRARARAYCVNGVVGTRSQGRPCNRKETIFFEIPHERVVLVASVHTLSIILISVLPILWPSRLRFFSAHRCMELAVVPSDVWR